MFHPSCCLACNQNLVFLCTSTVSRKWLLSQRPTCARRLFATHPHPPTCASSVRHYTTPNCSSWALTAGNATLFPRILPPLSSGPRSTIDQMTRIMLHGTRVTNSKSPFTKISANIVLTGEDSSSKANMKLSPSQTSTESPFRS